MGMSARFQMVMRVDVQRDTNHDADAQNAWGNDYTPSWATHTASLSCYAWYDGRRDRESIFDGSKQVEKMPLKVLVPLDSDLTPDDRLSSITDRKGTVLFLGPFKIDSLGNRPDHRILHVMGLS